MMFLQLSAILGPAKATLGDRVDTTLGSGVLRAYRAASDTYVVNLGETVMEFTPPCHGGSTYSFGF